MFVRKTILGTLGASILMLLFVAPGCGGDDTRAASDGGADGTMGADTGGQLDSTMGGDTGTNTDSGTRDTGVGADTGTPTDSGGGDSGQPPTDSGTVDAQPDAPGCTVDGQMCMFNSQCCSLVCNGATNNCGCSQVGAACNLPSDCCMGANCVMGVCAFTFNDGGACLPRGSMCTQQAQCCSMMCNMMSGKCQ